MAERFESSAWAPARAGGVARRTSRLRRDTRSRE
jgi:hypothetical protein